MLEYRNVYQTARNNANLTQESAAERLNLSVDSLRKYETDQRRPPDEVVSRMTQVYHSTYLGYLHLLSGPLGWILPSVEPKTLEQSTLRFSRLVEKLPRDGRLYHLAEINEDGIISADEMPLSNAIMLQVSEITETALELHFATLGQKESAQAAATATERKQNNLYIHDNALWGKCQLKGRF